MQRGFVGGVALRGPASFHRLLTYTYCLYVDVLGLDDVQIDGASPEFDLKVIDQAKGQPAFSGNCLTGAKRGNSGSVKAGNAVLRARGHRLGGGEVGDQCIQVDRAAEPVSTIG